jgi:hypothetical protein
MKKIKDVGKRGYEEVTVSKTRDVQTFDKVGFPTVIQDGKMIYPGQNSLFKSWPEVQFVEEFIDGKEATCGVIDNFREKEIYPLFPVEITHPKEFEFFNNCNESYINYLNIFCLFINLNYKKKIYLSSLDKEEFQQIKDIFRQIQRLKFCVQGIDYKISIIFKNYLCSIDDHDEIECYYIKNFNKGLNRKLFVSLNLNLLFDNIQNLEDNVQQVYDGVNQVLNKSQESHFEKFLMILDTCKDIKNKLDNIKNYRTHISSVIEKYETLITRSNHASNIITDKLVTLKKPDNISSDAYYINEKSKLENKLQNLNNVKGKAIEKLAILRDKDSNLLLKSDKILFDNIIMLNNVNNNLKDNK